VAYFAASTCSLIIGYYPCTSLQCSPAALACKDNLSQHLKSERIEVHKRAGQLKESISAVQMEHTAGCEERGNSKQIWARCQRLSTRTDGHHALQVKVGPCVNEGLQLYHILNRALQTTRRAQEIDRAGMLLPRASSNIDSTQ
jgi:hypothetical protein